MGAPRQAFPVLSAADYWRLLVRKLPRGVLWMQQGVVSGATYLDGLPVPLTSFSRMLMGCGDELARVHLMLQTLAPEAIPGTSDALLEGHERDMGLPDPWYVPARSDRAARRAAAAAKYAATGGVSRLYFLHLADAVEAAIDIVRGPRPNWWTVTGADFTRATCKSACNVSILTSTPLGARLSAMFLRYKPAQTGIFWTHA